MPIQTTCGGCGKQLSVADEHAGKRARCPACGTVFTVPSLSPVEQLDAFSTGQSSNPLAAQPMVPGGSSQNIHADSASVTTATDEMFWMRASDGNTYGPTDRDNLNRWFREGRVGIGYQIRQGDDGLWEDAALFRPELATGIGTGGQASSNPYAPQSTAWSAPATGAPLHKYPKADRGVIVLVMGILSFAICFVFGIVAIVMGKAALHDIKTGQANPNDKPLVQIGFWLGVASLILNVFAVGFVLLMMALSAVNQF